METVCRTLVGQVYSPPGTISQGSVALLAIQYRHTVRTEMKMKKNPLAG